MEAARAGGKKDGPTKSLTKEAEKTAMLAQTLYNERKLVINEIASDFKISKMALYKYLRHQGVKIHIVANVMAHKIGFDSHQIRFRFLNDSQPPVALLR